MCIRDSLTGAFVDSNTILPSDIGSEQLLALVIPDHTSWVGNSLVPDTGYYFDGSGNAVSGSNNSPVGSPTISGTALEGETLTADTSSIDDADGLGTFSYQWRRGDDDISGATGSSYVLTADDIGYGISVRVSYTDGRGTTETVLSAR